MVLCAIIDRSSIGDTNTHFLHRSMFPSLIRNGLALSACLAFAWALGFQLAAYGIDLL